MTQYNGRSSLECFALLMGKAQILEFGLKSLFARRFSVENEEMEKWTLGKIAHELERHGVRGDYVFFLKEFVKNRNYIAHEMLANNTIFRSLASEISQHFEYRQLWKPAHDLEHLLILHDWLEEHGLWV